MEQKISYKLHENYTYSQLRTEIYTLLDEIRDGGSLRDKAKAKDIDVDMLLEHDNGAIIDTDSEGGFDAALLTIILAPLAPVLAEVARDLWKEILLPHIKSSWGVDALEEKQSSE